LLRLLLGRQRYDSILAKTLEKLFRPFVSGK